MQTDTYLSQRKLQGAGFFEFALGDWKAVSVSDGFLMLDPMKAFMAPDAPEDEYQATLSRNFREKNSSYTHGNVLYLDTGKNKILFDNGTGSFM